MGDISRNGSSGQNDIYQDKMTYLEISYRGWLASLALELQYIYNSKVFLSLLSFYNNTNS